MHICSLILHFQIELINMQKSFTSTRSTPLKNPSCSTPKHPLTLDLRRYLGTQHSKPRYLDLGCNIRSCLWKQTLSCRGIMSLRRQRQHDAPSACAACGQRVMVRPAARHTQRRSHQAVRASSFVVVVCPKSVLYFEWWATGFPDGVDMRAVPMKKTSSFYNIGYRTKKILFSNPWFL